MMAAALGTDIGILHKGVLPATIVTVKYRNTMTPPKLPGNVPITKVIHPREIGLRPALGMEGDVSFANRLCSRFFKLINGNKPLLGEPWLKRCSAAIAVHDGVLKVFDVVEKAMLFKPRHNGIACLITIKARELTVTGNDHRVLIKDVDFLKTMRLAHCKVIGIVRRSDFHKARAISGVHVPVGEDRDLTIHDR